MLDPGHGVNVCIICMSGETLRKSVWRWLASQCLLIGTMCSRFAAALQRLWSAYTFRHSSRSSCTCVSHPCTACGQLLAEGYGTVQPTGELEQAVKGAANYAQSGAVMFMLAIHYLMSSKTTVQYHSAVCPAGGAEAGAGISV